MRLIEPAGLGAVPNPDLEFDQTLGLVTPHRRVIVRAARRVRVRASFWRRAAGAWDYRVLVERWRCKVANFLCEL